MVIHCSMHSFWATFKGKAQGKATIKNGLKEKWEKANPGKEFPIWGDFTGVASTKHGPKAPIKVTKCCDHEATQSLKAEGYTTTKAELYNNFYVTKDVKPLLNGTQKQGKKEAKAIVMWEVPQGKSKVIGLSLGHDIGEWNQPEFQGLLKDAVNYMVK